MSQGTLYVNQRIRGWLPKAIVKHLSLDVNVVNTEESLEQFSKDFPLKKIPGFAGPNGFKLTEVIAILFYLVNLSSDEETKNTLLGEDVATKAQVLRWVSLANTDLCSQLVLSLIHI